MAPLLYSEAKAMTPLRALCVCVVSCALIAFVAAPMDAHAAREQRSTGEFVAIVSHGPFDLDVRQGERTSVEVEGDDSVLPLIETVVEAGDSGAVLHVRVRKGAQLRTLSTMRVHITTAQLRSAALRGSGNLRLAAFQTPVLSLSVAGSGDAHVQGLSTEQLMVSIAGSGNVTGNGSAAKLSISIAGSGDVRLRELSAQQVEVNIAGSGGVQVNALKDLGVSIAGSGDVRYLGSPRIKSSVLGSGSVKALR